MKYVFYQGPSLSDPKPFNVVENIKNEAAMKAELPRINDDHVCVESLEKVISDLQSEVAVLKHDKFVQEFMAVLTAGGDAVLAEPLAVAETMQIAAPVVLDLSGHDIKLEKAKVGDGIFCVPAGGSLTIKGNGKVEVADQAEDDFAMAVWANGGDVIIEGGSFLNDAISGEADQYDLIYVKGGNLTIKGGIFKSKTPKWTLNKHDATDCVISVEGGSFFEYDPSASASENPVANFVAEGFMVVPEVKEDGTWYNVVPVEA